MHTLLNMEVEHGGAWQGCASYSLLSVVPSDVHTHTHTVPLEAVVAVLSEPVFKRSEEKIMKVGASEKLVVGLQESPPVCAGNYTAVLAELLPYSSSPFPICISVGIRLPSVATVFGSIAYAGPAYRHESCHFSSQPRW